MERTGGKRDGAIHDHRRHPLVRQAHLCCCPSRQKSSFFHEGRFRGGTQRLFVLYLLHLSALTFFLLSLCARGASARVGAAEPSTSSELFDAISEPLLFQKRLLLSGNKRSRPSLRRTFGDGSRRRRSGGDYHVLLADRESIDDRSGKEKEETSFWQTRACDENWSSWPRACYDSFPGEMLRQLRRRKRPLTMWTTEIHAGMRRELEALQAYLDVPLTVEFHDLWQLVEVARSCKRGAACDLPAPNVGLNMTKIYRKSLMNTIDIWRGCPRPRELRRQVFEAFSKHPEALAWSGLAQADLLYFSAPVVPFELFLPFDLPMIVQAPYGFELGRDLPQPGGEYYWDTVASWKAASRCATRGASPCKTPKMMASQSPYDVQVMRYVTGAAPLRLPCHGSIQKVKYASANSDAVTVAFGSRDYVDMRGLIETRNGRSWPWANASQIFAGIPGAKRFRFQELRTPFTFEQLSTQSAVVFIPYKPAVNFFLEIYEMNIPIFVPTPQLYAELDQQYRISFERIWCGGIPESNATDIKHRPNDTEIFEANKYWNSFADHYRYPHVVQFDSWLDLVQKLSAADFREISESMRAFNGKRKQFISKKWLSFFYDVHAAQADRTFIRSKHWAVLAKTSFDAQMKRRYGMPQLGRDAVEVLQGCDSYPLERLNLTDFRGHDES